MKHYYRFTANPTDEISAYLFNRQSYKPHIDSERYICRALRSYHMMIRTNYLFYHLFLAWKRHRLLRKTLIKGHTRNPLFIHTERHRLHYLRGLPLDRLESRLKK